MGGEQLNLPLSPEDQRHIDEAVAKMEARNKRFFDFHGLDDVDVEMGDGAYQEFLKRDMQREEKSFFKSPLGRKAFIVGWTIGVKTP